MDDCQETRERNMQAKQYEVRARWLSLAFGRDAACAEDSCVLVLQERILKLQDALELQKLKNMCTSSSLCAGHGL